jgi:hypothetical protein
MAGGSWTRRLADTRDVMRQRPGMVIGSATEGHLFLGTDQLLRLMFEKPTFSAPQRAFISASPTHYHCRCLSGPLRPELAALADWAEADNLLLAVEEIQKRMEKHPERWVLPFVGARFAFDSFVPLLMLADRCALAIRTQEGLWRQSYEHGWPMHAPSRVENAGDGLGLMIAVALSPEWFQGLPFTREEVERWIPEKAQPHVEVAWHDADDIVPEPVPDPASVLRRENIARWL